ncbi:DPP8 [Bugula neritina]|uniref:DPP8 n=1 Tax=Bugula neritina TaxID=10212 RepID=A0A7J7JCJ0_BUGNE|nr:DPP8 [Bugula neritina]
MESMVEKKTWKDLHDHVKDAKRLQSKLTHMLPDLFTFRTASDGRERVYFLGAPSGKKENTLMYADVTRDGQVLPWKQLVSICDPVDTAASALSKEEQLLQERKRSTLKGLTSYSAHNQSGNFVFSANSKLHMCCDADFTSEPLNVITLNTVSEAYVSDGDLWLYDLYTHSDHRLTFSKTVSAQGVQAVTSGSPSYIIQEEFSRYTGFWWQCTDTSALDGVYRILYEEVNESDVDVVSIVSPTSKKDGVEYYRYPRPGTTNATCKLRLLEFTLSGPTRQCTSSILDLHTDIQVLYPWSEYTVRADWCPDGERIWVQLLDRLQRKCALVIFPLQYFVSKQHGSSMIEPAPVHPQTIHEEVSDIWINVNNCLQFLETESETNLQYIWASERTGYRHLYLCNNDLTNLTHATVVPLTIGEWQVSAEHQIHFDKEKNLVYFMANKDTPLENHLYCVSLATGCISRLTSLGSSHQTTVSVNCNLVVSTFSSVITNPATHIYHISHDPVKEAAKLLLVNVLLPQTELDPGYQPPQLLTCPLSNSADVMHAMVYKPHNYTEGCKYPTLLFVYGGPQAQMVVNSNRAFRLIRLHTLASLGYAVVCIDGRGSSGRGLQWESHLKCRMGTVEIEDQVEGLKYLASSLGFIDMDRVAIHGWSYGGYTSLLGLLQRPDIFKLCISGAPVTKWEYYDTGYTEKYMETPTLNPLGYKNGSVVDSAHMFPDEDNRLLLIHGMIDENVHLVHTTTLVEELIKCCKPYKLQIYPNERHGIRNAEAGTHFETMVLSFLQDHL